MEIVDIINETDRKKNFIETIDQDHYYLKNA